MWLYLVLLALIPCLTSADVTCPDGKLSCPQNQRCCYEGDGYKCCDPVEDEENLKPGSPSMMITNMSSLEGIQNAGFGYDYCPSRAGRQICCTSITNCHAFSECCSNSINCCISGFRCCGGGQWCCERKQRCGSYYTSCKDAGVAVVPAAVTIGMLALAAVQSRKYFL